MINFNNNSNWAKVIWLRQNFIKYKHPSGLMKAVFSSDSLYPILKERMGYKNNTFTQFFEESLAAILTKIVNLNPQERHINLGDINTYNLKYWLYADPIAERYCKNDSSPESIKDVLEKAYSIYILDLFKNLIELVEVPSEFNQKFQNLTKTSNECECL